MRTECGTTNSLYAHARQATISSRQLFPAAYLDAAVPANARPIEVHAQQRAHHHAHRGAAAAQLQQGRMGQQTGICKRSGQKGSLRNGSPLAQLTCLLSARHSTCPAAVGLPTYMRSSVCACLSTSLPRCYPILPCPPGRCR